MPLDIGIEIGIEIKKIRQYQTKRLLPKKRRARVLERVGRDEDLPPTLPIVPTQFAALHVFQPAFCRRELSARADQQLPKVFLPEAEM
ncbi:hypothetical protein D4A92_22210 (plasmid) [Rhizobium rosettiformans]|uniref:Uncharacterized protein n=1 Tax=Rhizobium rosettiformans TaxID=1368430 RepID=A0ABX7F113_9HYPH|nr:hypothetical protein D4A92_22210 [Rhizobium rosettiformans]